MAGIADLLEKIKTAVYGKEVRGAIHDSIEQCYSDVSRGVTIANSAANSATQAAASATETADRMEALLDDLPDSYQDLVDEVNDLKSVVDSQRNFLHWTLTELTATGNTQSNSTKAVSSFETYRKGIAVIPETGCSLSLFFYDADKAYLGKVAGDGSINKTAGDWKIFTSRIEIDDYAPSDVKYFIIQISATDGTTFTWDNVYDFANSHVKIDDTSIDEINETLTSISETMLINHVDQHDLLSIPNSSIAVDGWYNVSPNYAHSKYNTNPFPAKAFKENTQYTLSFDAKYTGTVGSTLGIGFHYTDQTRKYVTVRGADENHYALTSDSGKTVERIVMTYNNANLTKVRNFMVVEGATEPDVFIPYDSETAVDLIARDAAKRANTELAPIRENVASLIQSDTGARMTTFTVQAGVSHSSTLDQISMVVNEGESVWCLAYGTNGRNTGVYFYSEDGTSSLSSSLVDGVPKKIKATLDTVRIGFFLGTGSADDSITLIVFKDGTAWQCMAEGYDNEFAAKLGNAKRKANSGRYSSLTSPEIFTLAHFSDIHGSGYAMQQVQTFKEKYKASLDDVLCTGDMVADKLADGMTFWNNNSDGTVLMCIGNHDSLNGQGWANPASQETLYNTYIAPYSSGWNAETVANHSYWYKDYADKKIRLITVDATIWDSTEQAAQITWLTSALSGAKTNGYSVVGAVHFPPLPATFQKIDCNFSSLLHGTATDMSQFAWSQNSGDFLNAVDAFINDGGDFVCWLCGHTHCDNVSYDSAHPKQLFIAVSSCSVSVGRLFEERARTKYEQSGLLFNVLCVDTVRKYVKLLRYGAEWDDCLRHSGTRVIKYDANPPQVMFQN